MEIRLNNWQINVKKIDPVTFISESNIAAGITQSEKASVMYILPKICIKWYKKD